MRTGSPSQEPVRLQGARLDSYGDHRIAMAFSVAALLAEGDSEISGSECVAISFPEFFELNRCGKVRAVSSQGFEFEGQTRSRTTPRNSELD